MSRELLTGARLDQALRWLKTHEHVLSDGERKYIRDSAAARRRWWLFFGSGALALVSILIALLVLRTTALDSAQTAEVESKRQQEIAEARRIAAEANVEFERKHPGEALLLAYEAAHLRGATSDVRAVVDRLASRVGGVALASSDHSEPSLAISPAGASLAVCQKSSITLVRLRDGIPSVERSLSVGVDPAVPDVCTFVQEGTLLILGLDHHLRAYSIASHLLAEADQSEYSRVQVSGDGAVVVAFDMGGKLHRWAGGRVGVDAGTTFDAVARDANAGWSVSNNGTIAFGDRSGTSIWSRDAVPSTPTRKLSIPNGVIDPTMRWIASLVDFRLTLYTSTGHRIDASTLEDATTCAGDVDFERPRFGTSGDTLTIERCRVWVFSLSKERLGAPYVTLAEFNSAMLHSPDGLKVAAMYPQRVRVSSSVSDCNSRDFGPATNLRFTDLDDVFVFERDTHEVLHADLTSRNNDERLVGHDAKIVNSVLSADSHVLVTADDAGIVRVWDLLSKHSWTGSAEIQLGELRSLVGRNLTAEEWSVHMGQLPYHKTFADLP